ncbi:hypothetical protein LOZ53_003225 [Ophidiomyces ophidiicola]|nr:hypothetical protein LOZ55_005229 [Ophidiomyces ophidiicola]KAI1983852.1 hypothetical protein LOZ54_004763 [Ophidiomyces ophidiicola]KAI1990346.1 hypothetical protein LOZ53_003225 [Ophidiomyces ophidiicola]KAI1998210.1 hypothetical protein LOZ51_002888 [Ophidiomyces ophidiicola]
MSSTRKRANGVVVTETAASSRPKRGAVAKDIAGPTSGPATKRATKPKANTGSKRSSTEQKTPEKSTIEVSRKRKATATKDGSNDASTVEVGKKRSKTRKTEADGKKAVRSIQANTKSNSNVKTKKDESTGARTYWLMKAEPESRLEKGVDVKFSIDDLREAKEPEPWDGVRNATARNHMRSMKKGDLALFYHSNCKVPGIAGTMEIVQEHSIDESAFDPAHPYYDPKSSRDSPKWEVVHVQFRSKLKKLITLAELKSLGKPGSALEDLQMLKQSRLSVSSVTPEQWEFIMGLAEEEDAEE